jgi:hypothetical protein
LMLRERPRYSGAFLRRQTVPNPYLRRIVCYYYFLKAPAAPFPLDRKMI